MHSLLGKTILKMVKSASQRSKARLKVDEKFLEAVKKKKKTAKKTQSPSSQCMHLFKNGSPPENVAAVTGCCVTRNSV